MSNIFFMHSISLSCINNIVAFHHLHLKQELSISHNIEDTFNNYTSGTAVELLPTKYLHTVSHLTNNQYTWSSLMYTGQAAHKFYFCGVVACFILLFYDLVRRLLVLVQANQASKHKIPV